jgi:hypothetical protein
VGYDVRCTFVENFGSTYYFSKIMTNFGSTYYFSKIHIPIFLLQPSLLGSSNGEQDKIAVAAASRDRRRKGVCRGRYGGRHGLSYW